MELEDGCRNRIGRFKYERRGRNSRLNGAIASRKISIVVVASVLLSCNQERRFPKSAAMIIISPPAAVRSSHMDGARKFN